MRRIVFAFLLLLVPSFLPAQQNLAPRPRPKIGLALEGGGAMGLAHIGVLKWFEEHHIPVDYVAGTSMGGLVGGFYATGMSPDELKTLIDGMDWRKILSDRTPFEQLSFRRKEDQRAYPNSLIFGLRDGLSLPAGLNAGHHAWPAVALGTRLTTQRMLREVHRKVNRTCCLCAGAGIPEPVQSQNGWGHRE